MKKVVITQVEKAEIIQDPFQVNVIQLTKVHADYFAALVQIFQQAFHPGKTAITVHHHLHQLLTDPKFIVLVALLSNKVIGGLTAHVLNNYNTTKPSVYLYDLAVLANLQRNGVGKRLISALIQLCGAKGFKEIFVQAEADDPNAINFYRSTPISGELQAMQFYYNLQDH